ncbi:MAG TPA: hypothetical protein VL200_16635 [Lacunisphaera sp.]|jgi:hypothetical protein|nr:hypothetical protein [Lacunisphaera sp.]
MKTKKRSGSAHSPASDEEREIIREHQATRQSGLSASARATEHAREGQPPSADNPKERSPKQENL